MIKAIKTRYKGYRFRSRLEARWAVFFDAVGLKWEYELGGFELPSGRYLPDFWLPEVMMWAEVKPIALDVIAETKLRDLVEHTQNGALKLVGTPDFRAYDGFEIMEFHDRPWEIMETDFIIDTQYLHEHRFYASTGHDRWPDETYFDDYYREAVYAARSARFEHGETPC